MTMNALVRFPLIALVLCLASPGHPYPLDGFARTGILRLEGYRLAQAGKVKARRLPLGARLAWDRVRLRLADRPGFKIPKIDTPLSHKIQALLGQGEDRFGIAVLDLSDPDRPGYGEIRGDFKANPGSVGKLVVALAVFQALADIFPDDTEKRMQLLRTAMVLADDFIRSDHHKVPFYTLESKKVELRPVRMGDRASLWTWLDWMMSASSNAAASMVMRELMLLVQFKQAYPISLEKARAFFNHTPRNQLGRLLAASLQEPLTRNGLDPAFLRQGSFFTRRGKALVPGTTSHATPRELMRFLVKLEQGALVDPFTSHEIKRILYMTQGRIRYASSPALAASAVYFKSGSLYSCKPEPGFKCYKYRGNGINLLNSVAIVEHPAPEPRLHYLVVVMSNVLRKNSALLHQTLATEIHGLMEKRHPGVN